MSDPHDYGRLPLAYLITFRAHGTWLHGDSRGSVDRFRNVYGTPRIPPDPHWQRYNERTMKLEPVNLYIQRRQSIDEGIQETCEIRRWKLWTRNVRTNHVHAVVSAPCDPEVCTSCFEGRCDSKDAGSKILA